MRNKPGFSTLKVVSYLLFVVTLGIWIAGGAHFGWTQTSVVQMEYDEVTGIDYPVQQDKFVAGVDVLGAGIVLSGVIFGAAIFFNRKQNRHHLK